MTTIVQQTKYKIFIHFQNDGKKKKKKKMPFNQNLKNHFPKEIFQ